MLDSITFLENYKHELVLAFDAVHYIYLGDDVKETNVKHASLRNGSSVFFGNVVLLS